MEKTWHSTKLKISLLVSSRWKAIDGGRVYLSKVHLWTVSHGSNKAGSITVLTINDAAVAYLLHIAMTTLQQSNPQAVSFEVVDIGSFEADIDHYWHENHHRHTCRHHGVAVRGEGELVNTDANQNDKEKNIDTNKIDQTRFTNGTDNEAAS